VRCAVFKRLRASEEWLRWLAEQQRGAQRLAVESQGRPVRAVDATTVSEPGSTGTDWRVHYAVNLANLQCDFFELTSVEGGETLRRIPVGAGDIMMGDRIYATPVGVAHVKAAEADMVVRLNRQSLPLFDADENRVNVLRLFRKMRVGQTQEWSTQVKHPNGGWVQGRWITLKRSAEATRVARRRLEINASKKQKKVSPESWEAAQYFFLWTTLAKSFAASGVLELYRLRWQIELAFKRMKSIMGLGICRKKTRPARAHGCMARFSPACWSNAWSRRTWVKAKPFHTALMTSRNRAVVNVGVTHGTAEFAAESIRRWWRLDGKRHYREAPRLLICADSGGSNGNRTRAWKHELATRQPGRRRDRHGHPTRPGKQHPGIQRQQRYGGHLHRGAAP
jgi:hypothetical protein